MVRKIGICAALLLLSLSTQAHALCRDDMKDLKKRIEHVKASNPERYYLAMKWWGRAQEAEPGSEVDCFNFLARARKALFAPLPEVANCGGPNAFLPACQAGDRGMTAGPVLPLDLGDDGLGRGGGGGGGVAPVAALPEGGGTVPFVPPGSVKAPSISPR